MTLSLTDEEFAALQLLRTKGIGAVSWKKLYHRFGSALAAVNALPNISKRAGGKPVKIASAQKLRQEILAMEEIGAQYCFWGHDDYPALMKNMANAPPVFGYKGDISLASRPVVGIVGARNSSAIACRFAAQLAGELAENGFVVASGLARGIDTAAHKGIMHGDRNWFGEGALPTIGVIASGLDIAYPPQNQDLQAAMAQHALVIAENPPGTEPNARLFPHRNRIIAGLSLGVVVVEAAPRSGSLITARLATEAGREVMAVPGNPMDGRAQGCNDLIRQGATLVQNADDVMEALAPIMEFSDDDRQLRDKRGEAAQYRLLENQADIFDEEDLFFADAAMDDAQHDDDSAIIAMGNVDVENPYEQIASLLAVTAISLDDVVRQSGLSAAMVQTVILDMELTGQVERHADGKIALTG